MSNEMIEKAKELLLLGEVVAIPTETVYGLAADATNNEAIARVYDLKGRPSFNPLIIHVASLEQAESIAVFNDKARALAKEYWPGGLTMVLPKKDINFASLATAGLDSVAIRVPAHPVARELIKKSELYIAAPSANLSGRLSPTSAAHVASDFPKLHVVDGGECEVGLESTVIGFDGGDIILLRPGVLQIEGALEKSMDKILSPGMLLKHYSPKNPIRMNVESASKSEVFLGFADIDGDLNLSASGDLIEAAANLFSMLHELDKAGKPIVVAPVTNEGIGKAINDRLNRAVS